MWGEGDWEEGLQEVSDGGLGLGGSGRGRVQGRREGALLLKGRRER